MNYVGQSKPKKHNTNISLDDIASLYGINVNGTNTANTKQENKNEYKRQKEYLQLLEADEIVKDYSSGVSLPDAEPDSFLDDLFSEPSITKHDLPDWYIETPRKTTNKKHSANKQSLTSSYTLRSTQRKNSTIISGMFDEMLDSNDSITRSTQEKDYETSSSKTREAERAEALRKATGIINGTSPIYKNNAGHADKPKSMLHLTSTNAKYELFDEDFTFPETGDDDFFDAMPSPSIAGNRRIELDERLPQINTNNYSPMIAPPSAPPIRTTSITQAHDDIPSLFKNNENSYVGTESNNMPPNNSQNGTQALFDKQNVISDCRNDGWENFDSDNIELDWIGNEPIQGYDDNGNPLQDTIKAKTKKKHGKKLLVTLLLAILGGTGYAMYSSGLINQLITSLPFF